MHSVTTSGAEDFFSKVSRLKTKLMSMVSSLPKLKLAFLVLFAIAVGSYYVSLPIRHAFMDILPGEVYLNSTFFNDGWNKENCKENYLCVPDASIFENGSLVSNAKCRIPRMNIWNHQLKEFYGTHGRIKCSRNYAMQTIPNLTYVRKQAIVINENLLKASGLKLTDITCCYHTIERINQDLSTYDSKADNGFQYSENCHPMTTLETTPNFGFTKVICHHSSGDHKHLHTDFHLLATLQPPQRKNVRWSTITEKKLKFWKENPSLARPPNVLLLGIDSTSRNHFLRLLRSTKAVFEGYYEAVDMQGYTKVGVNTFPNMLAVMSSHNEEEIDVICQSSPKLSQDNCPYIWKNYSAQNYFTAHIEDQMVGAIFHKKPIGFVDQPTDIYPRPWLVAALGENSIGCADASQSSGQAVLRYTEDLVEQLETKRIPYFITVWLTTITHDEALAALALDSILRDMLLRMYGGGFHENSVLFLMGDHGYWKSRPLAISKWYESTLPALWISIPKSLKKKFPEWKEALQHNSKELTSPFDIHETLAHVLHMSSKNPNTHRGRGVSLFEKLETRSCQEAGIPPQFCACSIPQPFNASDNKDIVKIASEAAMSKVNEVMPTHGCSVNLMVSEITAVAALSLKSSSFKPGIVNGKDILGGSYNLIIGIKTSISSIELEATVGYNKTTRRFFAISLLQTTTYKHECRWFIDWNI